MRGVAGGQPAEVAAFAVGKNAVRAPVGDVEIDMLERQRMRIAFDLHDGPCQTLSAALLRVRLIDAHAQPAEIRGRVDDVRLLILEALDQMHEMAAELRPMSLESTNLVERLEGYLESVRASGLEVTFTAEGDCDARLTASAQIAVFHIVQEALTNTRRHAKAGGAEVRLTITDSDIVCRVTDDGAGFDPESIVRFGEEHHGLRFMAERAFLLDGVVDISSAPGTGTAISVWIPRWC